jgi:zinc protease
VNDVKKEAGAVYGEFRKGRSDPFEQLTDTLFALAFPTHTYGHSTLGYENDIRAMPNALEHSKIFFNEYYRPENAIILVVGDVNSESVFATIEQHYRSWEPYTGPASPITEEPPQTETRRKHIDWEPSTAPLMTMAWRIPGHTEDSAALQVAADLLGSETNRLYERLIREEEIAYDIDVRRMSLVDPCLFLINVELKTTTAFNRAEQIIREEITSLVTSVDLDLLTRTKAKQKYGLLSSLDTPSAVANVLGWELRRTGSLENFEKYLNNYQMVDHKHIQQALTNYLIDPNLTMVTLGHTQASEEQP